MTSAEEFAKANEAFVDEDFDEALLHYNKAIELEKGNPEYLIKRANTYSKLNKHNEAFEDADKAVQLSEGQAELSAVTAKALLRKGIAAYNIKDFNTAKAAFQRSQELNAEEKSLVTWLRKVDTELEKTKVHNGTTTNTSQPANPPSSFLPSSRVRHEWFQNENHVTISIFIKNVKKEAVQVAIHERSISVTIKLPTGSDYSLELDPLAHEIAPSESKYEVLSTKVEVKLKKAQIGTKWGVLEGEDNLVGSISGGDGKLSYPSSARHAKNWDKLEREVSKEENKPEGEAALNALFQQLYRDADDDTRRAMMKSYVESSGTCLSTNWGEVQKGTVETKPPDGMVAKKWKE